MAEVVYSATGRRKSSVARVRLVPEMCIRDSDYTVYNEMHHKLDGNYKTWGLSFSAEYGKMCIRDRRDSCH